MYVAKIKSFSQLLVQTVYSSSYLTTDTTCVGPLHMTPVLDTEGMHTSLNTWIYVQTHTLHGLKLDITITIIKHFTKFILIHAHHFYFEKPYLCSVLFVLDAKLIKDGCLEGKLSQLEYFGPGHVC